MSEWLRTSWLASELRRVLSTQPEESAVIPWIWNRSEFLVGHPAAVWELVAIGTTYLVSGKPRFTLPYDLGAQAMLQKWGVTKVHVAPRNCSQLSVFSEFLAESGSVSNALSMIVSSPGPAAYMPCFLGNSSAIFSSEQGTHVTWVCEPICCFPSVAQSCPTLCDPMDTRLPCASPAPGACSHSCPLSQWCHPTISSSVIPFSSCIRSIFPSIRVSSCESVLCIRWPQYRSLSFSISLSYEYLGLISFRIDWFE